jgi:hypothetical protein
VSELFQKWIAGDLPLDRLKALPEDYLEIKEEDKPTMADTFGSLTDKLAIVTLKMWWNQEILYEIRRLTREEFDAKYGDNNSELYDILKRCCDLNVLRSQLIDEIDERLTKLAAAAGISEKEIEQLRLRAPSYKTY